MFLFEKYPETKKEFDKHLNKDLKYKDLTIGSMQKIWWRCSKGDDHIWHATANQRTSGGNLRGCPVCTGKKVVQSVCLLTTHPEIAKEWNFKKNGKLTARNVTAGSNKKVWWKCSFNPKHQWLASPKMRTKQSNTCPICNSLGCKFPRIAESWHPTLNSERSPFDIPYGSKTKFWWKCPKGTDHVWKATPNTRTSMNLGCPICSGYKVVKSNSLSVMFPALAVEWNFTNNQNIEPDNIYGKSTKKVWWQCPEGEDHQWKATVKSRANGTGCPICSGRKLVKSNSLAIRNPEIAKLWNHKRNMNLSAYQVTPFSRKVVWWKCSVGKDHEWQQTVANVTSGSSCPVCMNRKITITNNLFVLHPKLKQEWNFERNLNINPFKTSAGSKIKVWWTCKRDNSHEWYSTICDRTGKRSGCPFCAIKLNVSEINMLEMIKEIFPNYEIKYRYKPRWLKRMELDVYIPKLKMGFEYQGIQHFKPIDFFGGEETFIAQVQRDSLKKEICESHKIIIIYIYYDEDMTKQLIIKKVQKAGVLYDFST